MNRSSGTALLFFQMSTLKFLAMGNQDDVDNIFQQLQVRKEKPHHEFFLLYPSVSRLRRVSPDG